MWYNVNKLEILRNQKFKLNEMINRLKEIVKKYYKHKIIIKI